MKNNYKVYFLKSFLTFLGLLFAVGTFSIVNAAWNSYVNTGDIITSTLWNDMIGRLISHDTSITTLSTADSNNVKLTGNQTISDIKTFSNNVVLNATLQLNSKLILTKKSNDTEITLYKNFIGNPNNHFHFLPDIQKDTSVENIIFFGYNSAISGYGFNSKWSGVNKSYIWIDVSSDGIYLNSPTTISSNLSTFSLQVNGGSTITGISTDGTFSVNSDARLSTEKAIKTYVDGKNINITNGTTSFTGFKFIDGNQAAGKVLTSSADGTASWQSLTPGAGYTTRTLLVSGTVYQATSKGGFVVAMDDNNYAYNIEILVGSTNPPTTRAAKIRSNSRAIPDGSVSSPILPNEYFKVNGATSVYFYE